MKFFMPSSLLKITFLVASFLMFLPNASATHVASGDIQYRYIGDSTNTPHHYEIIMRLYRDQASGVGLGNTLNVTRSSSCQGNANITVTLQPGTGAGVVAPSLFDCVPQPPPGPNRIFEYYLYRGTTILPGTCSDYKFSWGVCCRNCPDNLGPCAGNNGPTFHIEARLNNTLGNNSSPLFVSEPVRAFCVGRQFNWAQTSIELDGDSIFYTLVAAKEQAGGGTPIPGYVAPYTPQQPLPVPPGQPLVMNPTTGNITFEATLQGSFVVAIEAQEYRFDSLQFQWYQVGSSNRDLVVGIYTNCSPIAQQGVQLDYNQPGMYMDSITGLPTVDYNCLDDRVKLFFSVALDCNTVDQGDFRLTRPDGQPIPIQDLEPFCDNNNEAEELDVVLFRPLFLNGDYILYSKKGNDGNTLVNKCGFAMPEFDTIILRVGDCPVLDWDLLNVSVVENEYPEVTWRWVHDSIPEGTFDEFEILRSPNNGVNYFVAGIEPDSTVTVFEDIQLTTQNVNERFYRYKLAVKLAGDYIDSTRSIRSIFLRNINPNMDGTETVELRWNSYDGWPSPEYTLMWSKDEGGPLNWQPVDVPQNPTMDTAMDFNMPPTWDEGNYNLRIDASDSTGNIGFVSHSNWISFELLDPPPLPIDSIVIPSVFTPNNDGKNDFFTIQNIDTWTTKRSVVVYNRWGKKVYEATMYDNGNPWDGRDMSTGAALPDGVYFYVIDIENEPTNSQEQHKGTVTISRGM